MEPLLLPSSAEENAAIMHLWQKTAAAAQHRNSRKDMSMRMGLSFGKEGYKPPKHV